MKINAILLKPLDGAAPGAPRQFEQDDFNRLRALSAVREAGPSDVVAEPQDDAAAVMLERLRHSVDGPRLLAEMQASFERHEVERNKLIGDLTDANSRLDTATFDLTSVRGERDQLSQSNAGLVSENAALTARVAELEATIAAVLPAEPVGAADQPVEPAPEKPAKVKG